MKVCNVVCNSVWYDPRVIKQIASYKSEADIDLSCVGVECGRYDKEKVEALQIPITIVEKPEKYSSLKPMKTPFGKVMREIVQVRMVADAITAYQPDIIHANDLNAFMPAMLAARRLGCRVVYDSHEIYAENHHIVVNKLYSRLLRCIEKRLVRHCDQMVCVSHAAAGYFARTYGIKEPMVVTNCVSKNQIPLERREESCFEVLNHGQYIAGRGFDLMAKSCDCFEGYPEIKLAVRGLGRYEAVLREIVAKAKNQEIFRFNPPVTVQELIPMAGKSHVGVAITEPICLNFELSVSNKLFEYAAAGLPVIMSDIPEHRYLNGKYDFGLIIPENTPEAFSAAVIRLYEDRELYRRLAANAEKMSREVNWEADFGRLIDVERKLFRESR